MVVFPAPLVSHLIDTESYIYVLDSLDFGGFLLFCFHRHGHSDIHCLLVEFGSLDCQPALLVVYDVASDRFAEYLFVAECVQPVVRNLECETESITISVEVACIFVRSASYQCSHFRGASDQHGSLQSDHHHVLVHRNLLDLLEVHVILLTFTYLGSGVVEQLEHFAEHVFRSLCDSPVAVDTHHVS